MKAERGNLPDEILAVSGEGYSNRSHARAMAASLFPRYKMEEEER